MNRANFIESTSAFAFVMLRNQTIQRILEVRVIAVVRLDERDAVLPVVNSLVEGGISCIEITMTVPDALSLIRETAAAADPGTLIGAGSVTDADSARRCIDAGATFVVGPVFKPEIIAAVHELDAVAIPGAFTPTEILAAHEAGADMVKIFPADTLGHSFIKAVRAPMPGLRLIPTGGVTPENAVQWLRAGACAVGIGSALIDPAAVRRRDYASIAARARALMTELRSGSGNG